jgi:predicted Rossmann fold nucleotide-binding protein DprA/Smf involved in DNA uptake
MIDLVTGNLPDEEFASRDSAESMRVLDALSATPQSLAKIAARSGIAEATAERVLDQLESDSRARRESGGWVTEGNRGG